MKAIKWNPAKEKILQEDSTRGGVTFADCLVALEDRRMLANIAHPTRPNQRLLVLDIHNYAYAVPFVVEDDGSWFLKTVFPSRTLTAQYLLKKQK